MYRLKSTVSSCTVRNIVIEDHEPRPTAFWGDKLKPLIEGGFLEEMKEDPEKEEAKEDKKKKGV